MGSNQNKGQDIPSSSAFNHHSLVLSVLILCLLVFFSACGNDRVTLEDPDVIFVESFKAGETGEWNVEADDAGRTAVINEQLIIEIEEPNLVQYSALLEPGFSDFLLEVDATQMAGALESSYGVLFRMQSPSQFYRFDITSSGLFMLERHNADGSRTQFLDDWMESSAIKQGLTVVNRLKIVALGADLTIYVNDQMLHEVTDPGYTGGQIALDAGTFGQSGLQVAFDNLVVRKP